MSASGLIVQSSRHTAAIERLLSTSKRAAVTVCKQEFGITLTTVAKYTPPASAGVTGKKAEKQGKAKVAGDILSIYGTPGDAYDAVAAKSPAQASAFWLMKGRGDDDMAADIVRAATGKSFSPFDGGALHERVSPAGRKRRKKEHLYYVSNVQSLISYIQQEESHVWWLASGWAPALRALGRKLPYGVDKGNAPGSFKLGINNRQITLTAIDAVSWASNVRDIQRRVLWASEMRADALQRAWDHNLKRLAGEAGMKTA